MEVVVEADWRPWRPPKLRLEAPSSTWSILLWPISLNCLNLGYWATDGNLAVEVGVGNGRGRMLPQRQQRPTFVFWSFLLFHAWHPSFWTFFDALESFHFQTCCNYPDLASSMNLCPVSCRRAQPWWSIRSKTNCVECCFANLVCYLCKQKRNSLWLFRYLKTEIQIILCTACNFW